MALPYLEFGFMKLEDPWNQNKPRVVDEPLPTQDPAVLQSKRDHILTELLDTEQAYVTELLSIIDVSLGLPAYQK